MQSPGGSGRCSRAVAAILCAFLVNGACRRDSSVRNKADASGAAPLHNAPRAKWDPSAGRIILTSGRLELVVETSHGLNARQLRDTVSGQTFADRDYVWPGGGFPEMDGEPALVELENGGRSVTIKGRLEPLEVEQTFTAPAGEPGVILESITLRNRSDHPLSAARFACGFAKRIRGAGLSPSDADAIRVCPVPYRRETNGRLQEFPLSEVAAHGMSFAGWMETPVTTPAWGAEGWVWSKDSTAFLIAKYNPEAMEWSLMEPVERGPEAAVRFAGAGQWKHGHPEGASALAPGQSFRFGETRLQVVEGDWQQAFYAYRRALEAKGCRAPWDYDPPVHWNELYDNSYFSKAGETFKDWKDIYSPDFNARNEKLLKTYYSRELMLAEAAKARELGCEALYMDPGWDTGPEEHIWDAARLGPMDSFVKKLKDEYGLRSPYGFPWAACPRPIPTPSAVPPRRGSSMRTERPRIFFASLLPRSSRQRRSGFSSSAARASPS